RSTRCRLAKSLGMSTFLCSTLNTISIWSSQEAYTGSQWMRTSKRSPSERIQAANCFGGVSGTVIQNEIEDAGPFAPQTGEQHLQEQLKFREPLPLEAARQRFPAVHQQAGEQLHGALALIRSPTCRG